MIKKIKRFHTQFILKIIFCKIYKKIINDKQNLLIQTKNTKLTAIEKSKKIVHQV